jgi:hypothetical protein
MLLGDVAELNKTSNPIKHLPGPIDRNLYVLGKGSSPEPHCACRCLKGQCLHPRSFASCDGGPALMC